MSGYFCGIDRDLGHCKLLISTSVIPRRVYHGYVNPCNSACDYAEYQPQFVDMLYIPRLAYT